MNHESDSIAIVTGASSGIGRAVAQSLAESGAHTVLFDVAEDPARSLAQSLNARGLEATAMQVDVGDEQQVTRALDEVTAAIGLPRMLCNSAAIQQYGRTENVTFEDWRRLLNVNLNGTYFMCKATLPSLVQTGGSIVNITSLAGKIGLPYDVAYSASKGGVIAMTKALAKEYADRNVRINAIAPGAVATPMYETAIPEDINPEVLKVIPRSACGMAKPADIASLVHYLLLQAPGFLTGSIVSIDGASN